MSAILLKEFRSFLRMGRPFLTLTLYLLVIGGLMFLIYTANVSSPFVNRSNIGQSLFVLIIGFSLLQLTFLAPAFHASALGIERDRQTIDLLMITPISTTKLIIGKMAAPLVYLLLLSLATIPLASFAFFIGGIELIDIAVGLLLLILTMVGYGSIGMWAASRAASSRSGLFMAQGLAFFLAILLPILSLISAAIIGPMSTTSSLAEWVLTSPIIRWPVLILLSLSPFVVLFTWIVFVLDQGNSIWTMDMPAELGGGTVPALWIIATVTWLIVVPWMIWRSSRRLPRSVAQQGGG